jgi:hypothetical protein
VGGIFFARTASGFTIDLFASSNGVDPLDAYRLVFALQVAFIVVAVGVCDGARSLARRRAGGDRVRLMASFFALWIRSGWSK